MHRFGALLRLIAAGVLIVGILATHLPVPLGAAAQTPRQLTSHLRCASFEVITDSPRERDIPLWALGTRVRIERNRRTAWSLGGPENPIWAMSVGCRDVTGDHVAEVLIRTYSGGAHCCTNLYIISFRPTVRLLLHYDAGNGGDYDLVDLNQDGRLELVLIDDRFAYFDDLCFTCSPAGMPLVACFQGGRFADCTGAFPGKVREAASYWTSRLREEITRGPRAPGHEQFVRGAALGVYATYALLGEEEKGLRVVWDMTATPAVTDWLERHRYTVRLWASSRGKRLEPGP